MSACHMRFDVVNNKRFVSAKIAQGEQIKEYSLSNECL